jgi:pimeloyl-ACP methyl ester carboxylesterase
MNHNSLHSALLMLFLLAISQVEAANIQVGDDTSMVVPIADKNADEKAVILNRRAWYFLQGDHTARRLRLLDSNANQLILRLNAVVKPGSYELYVQAPGHKKLAINHNLQVHSPRIHEASADSLFTGGRVILSGIYFGQNPRLFLEYQIGDDPKLRSRRVKADAQSFKFDDRWDKYATLYPTDTLTGESYLEVVIPPLPAQSLVVGIRIVSDTGQVTRFSRSYKNRSVKAQAQGGAHQRGELIGWSLRDADVPSTKAWDFMLNGLTDQGGWWSKVAANGLLISTKLWRDMKYSLRLYSVSYYTVDTKGRIVPSAGVLVAPVRSPGTKTPLISFQHGTMLEKKQAPTVSNGPELGMAIAMASASGFLMAVPDHLGLGIKALQDQEQFHPYCQWAPLARDNGDMLVAVQSLLRDKTFHRVANDAPSHDGRLFLTGYSEGGYITLGLHRELESHPDQYGHMKVTASVPLSGGYASSTTMIDKLMGREKFSSPGFAAYLWITLNQTYGIFPTPDLYLNSPYHKTLPPLIDGRHSEAQVNQAMPLIVEDILVPALRNELKGGVGEFFAAVRANDLAGADGSGYRLEAPVHFIHGADDELVPRENTERATDYLRNKQMNPDVDAQYLESNPVMWSARLLGLPYHASYAPLAIGESLDWLQKKTAETQSLAK